MEKTLCQLYQRDESEKRGRGSWKLRTKSQAAKATAGHARSSTHLHRLLPLEILRRDSDHHHQCRLPSRLRSPKNLLQPHKLSHLVAGMSSKIRAPGGQRHSKNVQRLRKHWSYEMGNTARWDQEKSSCYQRLAGGKNWICSLVRANTTSNKRVIPALTLGLHW